MEYVLFKRHTVEDSQSICETLNEKFEKGIERILLMEQ